MRVGGLPSRFRIEAAVDEGVCCGDDFYVLPGCDPRERIFLGPKAKLSYEDFIQRVCSEADATPDAFSTTLILSGAFRAEELQKSACEACMQVDTLVVAGLSQVRYGKVKPVPDVEWDKVMAARIEFALLESRVDLLEQAIRDLAVGWKVQSLPLISVESQLRRILHFVLRKAPHADTSMDANLEFLLEEALGGVGGFGDISDAAWKLVSKASGAEGPAFRASDVPAFFHAITRHVEERYAESLNLASLSATFRISSSYLSKLFRQHAGRSFGEYLASIRIEMAKRLIRENPAMPLKDVAERVGFPDPFYFSRVFKTVVGKAPSEYARLGE
jgi:AraC-like DNA-binding protein